MIDASPAASIRAPHKCQLHPDSPSQPGAFANPETQGKVSLLISPCSGQPLGTAAELGKPDLHKGRVKLYPYI